MVKRARFEFDTYFLCFQKIKGSFRKKVQLNDQTAHSVLIFPCSWVVLEGFSQPTV